MGDNHKMTSRKAPCAGCRGEVSADGPYMKCAKCKQIFDIICANFTAAVFNTLTTDFKSTWICVECLSRQPKHDNSHTPVRQSQTQDLSRTTSDCLDISMQTPDNVTVRTRARYTQAPIGNKAEDALVKSLKDSVVQELKKLQVDFEAQLVSKINTILIEQFLAFKTEFMDKINLVMNKVLEFEEQYKSDRNNANESTTKAKKSASSNTFTPLVTTENKPVSITAPPPKRKPQTKTKPVILEVQAGPLTPRVLNNHKDIQARSSSSISMPNTHDDVEGADKGDWEEVRRKRSRTSHSGLLRGTAAPGSTLLQAAERRRYLHLYYVREGTTVEQVREHLHTICSSGECTVEKLNSRGAYASFKLGVPMNQAENVMSSDNWDKDICIKPWRQNFRTTGKNNQV